MQIYLSVSHNQWYLTPTESPWEFEMDIPREHLFVLDKLMHPIGHLEWSNFIRAQTPYIPYHLDPENDALDYRLKRLYAFIHTYVNEEGKEVIEKMPYYKEQQDVYLS
ncbi:transposase [Paenisporosarcina cavernae]|uniref:Transposase n=1 Tax=Paenisporosarcina cavernae TaxID=2320858 RepID=A0A385YSU4_9BACL|nr:transposase [Paenisporosarcina cavernae]AYC29915.1 transposase [Paenisporosarcina cavernae]